MDFLSNIPTSLFLYGLGFLGFLIGGRYVCKKLVELGKTQEKEAALESRARVVQIAKTNREELEKLSDVELNHYIATGEWLHNDKR